ncbi:MAG: transcriptional regulator NrdR [Chthoniobacterales bacterium]
MRCPNCDSLDDKVVDSRLSKDGNSIRRRRECLACFTRYTTYEEIERVQMRVIKRDERHEPFDRQKVMASFMKACEKRPISTDTIETAVQKIITDFEAANEREVSTREVGRKVMEALRGMDPIAYVRFASVYREFQEIGDFIDEIESFERRVLSGPAQPELFNP